MASIPTYIINLKHRTDRKENILKEFSGKRLYRTTIVEAVENSYGALGLWETIIHILEKISDQNEEYVLICEDDHEFTADYSDLKLLQCIEEAKERNADVLCGGVSWFDNVIPVSDNLFWVDSFTGTQFIILFKKFWSKLIEAPFGRMDTADSKIYNISSNVFLTSPFLSRQRDYGYSDATPRNNIANAVNSLFNTSIATVEIVKKVAQHYKQKNMADLPAYDLDLLTIPTYIINLPARKDRRAHIEAQFAGRQEFDVIFVDAVQHEVGALGHWLSVRKVVQQAIDNDDDVIIICEDDHEFTRDYTKEYLLSNIIEAGAQDCSYLSGGTSKFRTAIPVAGNRYWVSSCLASQFIVLYRSSFANILEEPFVDNPIGDQLLSEIITNKMILYPFVSIQRNFGYSDVTPLHNMDVTLVSRMFDHSNRVMEKLTRAQKRFDSLACHNETNS